MKPAFRFARGGKVYKELEADEAHQIAGYIRTGIIGANDDYWMPGMTDWKKVNSRQWDFPSPDAGATTTTKPTAMQPTPVAQANSPQPTRQAASQATAYHPYDCATCRKGFDEPANAVSGYSVIGKAALFFVVGCVLLAVSWGIYTNWTMPAFFGGSRANLVLSATVYLIVSLSGLGLLLMCLFELIAAAVTHGLYRANPQRCPHCKSHTFTRRI